MLRESAAVNMLTEIGFGILLMFAAICELWPLFLSAFFFEIEARSNKDNKLSETAFCDASNEFNSYKRMGEKRITFFLPLHSFFFIFFPRHSSLHNPWQSILLFTYFFSSQTLRRLLNNHVLLSSCLVSSSFFFTVFLFQNLAL